MSTHVEPQEQNNQSENDTAISPYQMTINLNALNHLGINLYSNVPSVMSEIIANAWDADATEVKITITEGNTSITITDDGIGMTLDDINDKFLNVGYQKRENGEIITDRGRAPMGRKGIGKLSMFSIAEEVEIYSVKDGQTSAFLMSVEDIKKSINDKEAIYKPVPIKNPIIEKNVSTKIVLKSLKKGIHGLQDFLAKRIARRFGILGEQHDFIVFVNDKPVTIADRDYFHKLEYIWYFGFDSEQYKDFCNDKKLKDSQILDNVIKVGDDSYSVTGWLGLVEHAGDLKDADESINKITIMVRNKLAQEDILEEYGEGGMYTKYLIGEVYADFLDLDSKDDIATSSRQKIMEDDIRYSAVKSFLHAHLKTIQSKRAQYKDSDGTVKALSYTSVKAWYDTLGQDTKKKAKKLFGKINQIELDNPAAKAELFKQGVLAFEKLRHKDALDSLDAISIDQFETYTQALCDFDDFEAIHYHQITEGRLKVIEIFNDKVDLDLLEKHLQQYLFDHLWLLDPSWERGTQTPIMEKQVHQAFDEISKKLSAEEKSGRVDIRYQKASGKHIIIELKRASVKTTTFALQGQVDKYMKALKKQLETIGKENEPIEAYCILGNDPTNWASQSDKEKGRKALKEEDIYIMNYKELIQSSYETYKEYLIKKQDTNKILNILNNIEDELLQGS